MENERSEPLTGMLFSIATALALLHLSACSSSAEKLFSGQAELRFMRSSPTGLQLELRNGSNRAISFRGTLGSSAADPWNTLMECKESDSDEWLEEPYGLVDGEDRKVEVLPGESVLLEISDDFASRYKGGVCHVSLRLFGGIFIKSNDFRP